MKLSSNGYVSTWMGDRLCALLVCLMALQLVPVDQKPLLVFLVTVQICPVYTFGRYDNREIKCGN